MTTHRPLLPATVLASLLVAALLSACTTAPAPIPAAQPKPPSAGTPSTGTLSAGTQNESSIMMVSPKPQQGKLADVLKAQVAKATQLGRTPFVELSATWCGPCHELEKSMKDPRMVDAFAGTYIIHLDIDDWDKKLLDTLGISGRGVPAMYALNKEGKGTGSDITREIKSDADDPAGMAPEFKKYFDEHRWP